MRRRLLVRGALVGALLVPGVVVVQGCGACAMSPTGRPEASVIDTEGCSNPSPTHTYPPLGTSSPPPNVRDN